MEDTLWEFGIAPARFPLQTSAIGSPSAPRRREICELALDHVNCDRVEAAYRRSDLFERRRTLMQQ